MSTNSLPQQVPLIHRPTPVPAAAVAASRSSSEGAALSFTATIIPTSSARVTTPADLVDIGKLLLGLEHFASRLDAQNKTLTHQLRQLQPPTPRLAQSLCSRCRSPCTRADNDNDNNPVAHSDPPTGPAHTIARSLEPDSTLPHPQPASPSPDSSFDLISAEDRWDSHAATHTAPVPAATESSSLPSPSTVRKDSWSISHLLPATPKSPALHASETSISLLKPPVLTPGSSTSIMGPNPPTATGDGTPSSRPASLHPPVSPVPSSALAGSNLQALCQDLARLIWTSTRPLMILDQHQEIEQSADANGTAGAETSMKTKDKAVMTLEEEEIADPVPDIGEEPTPEQMAAVLRAAEERLLRLSDMFKQALHDRDILQNHLNSYYHHMAIDRVIRRDNIRNTGGPSNAASANNAAAAGDKNNSGGGVGGAPASPPPLVMDPPMSPLGATSFRVGSYGTGSMGYGRGGTGGHDFGGIGGMDSMGGRYIGSAMGRGAEPDAMMQFMHMDDFEI